MFRSPDSLLVFHLVEKQLFFIGVEKSPKR